VKSRKPIARCSPLTSNDADDARADAPPVTIIAFSMWADPSALGGAVLLLVVVALIATLVPVRRALRIDPMDALRTD